MPGSHCKERDRDPAVEVKPPIQSLTQVPEATRGLGNQPPLTAPPKDPGGLGRPSPDPGLESLATKLEPWASNEAMRADGIRRKQGPATTREDRRTAPSVYMLDLTRGDRSREQRPQQSQGTKSQGITRLAPHWTPLYKEKTAPRAQFRVGGLRIGYNLNLSLLCVTILITSDHYLSYTLKLELVVINVTKLTSNKILQILVSIVFPPPHGLSQTIRLG